MANKFHMTPGKAGLSEADVNALISAARPAELVAYCTVDGNRDATGEFTYLGEKRGLVASWAVGGIITIERDTLDDTIADDLWMSTNEALYQIKMNWRYEYADENGASTGQFLICKDWAATAGPIDSELGYCRFVWVDTGGTILTGSPADPTDVFVTYEVWKYYE